jgi:hypothetical protein
VTFRVSQFGLVLAALPLAGCLGDAPHDNPLDPDSASYRDAGTVEGHVTGIYPPFAGRADARVHLVPLDGGGAERVVRTDGAGAFLVEGLPGGAYEVRAEGAGFRADTDTVDVTAGAVVETTLQLDALPVVTSQSVWTVHIDQWPPGAPLYQLEVDVTAADPDRALDVEGAALVVEGLQFREPLFERAPGEFTATLDASQFPGGRVQSLLGRSLRVEVRDHLGNTSLGPPLALVRVVEQTPLTARPQGLETVAQNPPTLEWRPSDLPFAFTYRIDVSFIDGAGVPVLVETRSGLPPTATTYAVTTALAPGDYIWTVWTVDEAGNRSRSKPAGFRVP